MRYSDQEQRDAFIAVVKKTEAPLTEADLQVLREHAAQAAAIGGMGTNSLNFRMDVELIDAIRNLNATSTALAKVGIFVGSVGVILTLVQVVLHYR
jgi:hypothetical protein